MIYVIDHQDSFTHNVVHQLSLFFYVADCAVVGSLHSRRRCVTVGYMCVAVGLLHRRGIGGKTFQMVCCSNVLWLFHWHRWFWGANAPSTIGHLPPRAMAPAIYGVYMHFSTVYPLHAPLIR